MKKRYSVIAFDLGNTVIKFDHNISAGKISDLFRLDPKKVYDLFFDSPITRDFEKGLISSKEFYNRAIGFLGVSLSFDDFASMWNDIFWEDLEVCDMVRRLKGSYRLFLLSNVNEMHFEHIRKKFRIIDVFDELILSYMVGSMKPERPIFEEAIRRAGGEKEGLLYIDDRQDLVDAARQMGIDSIRFEGSGKLISQMRARGIQI